MPRLRSVSLRLALFAALALLWAASLPGCSLLLLMADDSDFNGQFERTSRVLLVVDDRRALALAGAVDQYRQDLQAEGIAVEVAGWSGGTASALRAQLTAAFNVRAFGAAFLVGNLPAAWYRMSTATGYEEFPCDLYLSDPGSNWSDTNGDGRFDAHSPLAPKFAVSRIVGTDAELLRYFSKIHRYRAGELRLPAGAYVFKDDSWFDYRPGSSFGLSLIYPTVDISETPGQTRRSDYLSTLSNDGAEFVYQWIHSYPSALCIQENTSYAICGTRDIAAANVKGLFYNLYDCSAARFTELNLGMSYLTGTDYALAVFGSTKVGGCYHPLVFYQTLAVQGTWGDAWRTWYTHDGRRDDGWFLGMVILGDPALTVSTRAPIYRFIDMTLPARPDARTIESLEKINLEFDPLRTEGSFEEYRKSHPE